MTLDPTTRTLPGPQVQFGSQQLPDDPSRRWIVVMARALAKRRRRFDLLEHYYRGTQDNRKLATEAWRRIGFNIVFPNLNANHSRLVVKAAVDRLEILGFRLGGELEADTEAWRIWRANDMETTARQAHVESLVKGECPMLVEPDPTMDLPRLTPQDPRDVIVWHAPGDRRIRRAALKTWQDEWTGRRMFVLYLPDRIERWQERERSQFDAWLNTDGISFDPMLLEYREPQGYPAVIENPLGEVPVVTLPNDPRLSGSPEGEHEVVLPLIDAYTKGLMDMVVASHELAFPQRYMIGVDEEDEKPVYDQNGAIIADAPVRVRTGPDRSIVLRNPDGTIGQLSAADLSGYVKQLEQIRGEIATITFRPYHYILNMPSSVPPSGESITAAEAPFADNVRGHGTDKGVAWRHVMRLAFKLKGDDARAAAMASGEPIWRDPERRTESQHVDALGKAVQMLGMPIRAAWERLPASPQDIARWQQMRSGEPTSDPVPLTAIEE